MEGYGTEDLNGPNRQLQYIPIHEIKIVCETFEKKISKESKFTEILNKIGSYLLHAFLYYNRGHIS